jgi:hypothetical protein
VHNLLSTAAQAAKAVGGETRTTDQLRADYLLAPFHAALQSGELAGITPIKLAKHHLHPDAALDRPTDREREAGAPSPDCETTTDTRSRRRPAAVLTSRGSGNAPPF